MAKHYEKKDTTPQEKKDKEAVAKAKLIKFPLLLRLQRTSLKEDVLEILSIPKITDEQKVQKILDIVALQHTEFCRFLGLKINELLKEMNVDATYFKKAYTRTHITDLRDATFPIGGREKTEEGKE